MLLGFDIGGTKCAVITAENKNNKIEIINKRKIPTDLGISPKEMISRLIALADEIITENPESIGISCGGPLDSKNGVIMSPPNLPGWDNVPIAEMLQNHFGVKAKLQNDANACAVAEWKFGAGKGSEHMIFLTFGTGLGAGLILNGKLYSGANDNAGECGHIRLNKFGPVGYGKSGSFEGFCSGGGLSQLGYSLALEQIQKGYYPSYYKEGMTQKDVTAKGLANAARQGDETALKVWEICGEYLGKGLSLLIDILNPQKIVLGSIFARSGDLLTGAMKRIIAEEALSEAAKCCEIVPALLGEEIGDYAAIGVALL